VSVAKTFRGWGGAALVTGASSGIGREIAKQLAGRGMSVILTARSRDALEALSREIRSLHPVRVETICADLCKNDAPQLIEQECRRMGMPIDLLVNNAGFGVYGPFGSQGASREAELVRLNVMAPVELAARFLPGMIERGHGIIYNVASTAAFAPVPWIGSYAATKAHLLSWTHSLDIELQGTGVRAMVLCPGSTETNFHQVSGAAGRQRKNLFPKLSAEDVARQGLEGIDRGKRVVVTGWVNRIHTAIASIVPDAWAAALAFNVMGPARRRQDAR
jgi:short-subunit dehydrogenase